MHRGPWSLGAQRDWRDWSARLRCSTRQLWEALLPSQMTPRCTQTLSDATPPFNCSPYPDVLHDQCSTPDYRRRRKSGRAVGSALRARTRRHARERARGDCAFMCLPLCISGAAFIRPHIYPLIARVDTLPPTEPSFCNLRQTTLSLTHACCRPADSQQQPT